MRKLTALLLALVLAAGGCTGTPPETQLTVLASWTGEEETLFKEVLAEFHRETRIRVHYRGTRALGQVLRAEVSAGRPPDIAVLPGFGDLMPYLRERQIRPLKTVVNLSGSQWPRLQRAGLPEIYAAPVKIDLKGLVWSHPRTPAPEQAEDLLAAGDWCLGLESAATSGWPGTDWVENLLLQRAGPQIYQRWVAGDLPWTSDQVRQAWLDFGRIIGPRAPAALLTDFWAAGRAMFDRPPGCRRDHQGSFIATGYQTDPRRPAYPADFTYRPFPAFPGAPTASPFSADLAARFTDNPAADQLIHHLTRDPAPQPGPAELNTRLRDRLAGEQTLCFDASDLMPVELRTMFYRAVLEYVADQGRLPALLDRLEGVRRSLQDDQERRYGWVTVACGR